MTEECEGCHALGECLFPEECMSADADEETDELIHTDGKPTICTMGPIPGLDDDQTRAMHQVARDLAAVSNISIAEALRRICGSVSPREAMLLEEAGDD